MLLRKTSRRRVGFGALRCVSAMTRILSGAARMSPAAGRDLALRCMGMLAQLPWGTALIQHIGQQNGS